MATGFFYPFTSAVDGNLNPKSALPRAALLTCLYWKKPEDFQKVLGYCGGGFLLAMELDNTGALPSYAIFRVGAMFHVVIAGTENLTPQVFPGHLAGIIGKKYQQKATVNIFFAIAAKTIFDVLKSKWAGVAKPFLSASGHSYGGAVAEILCDLAYEDSLGNSQIECLTFGAPKAFDENVEAHFLDLRRVIIPGDPVPLLPPIGPVVIPTAFLSRPIAWSHYGELHQLDRDGLQTRGRIDIDVPPGASLVNPDFSKHRFAAYAELLNRDQVNSDRGGFLDNVAILMVGVIAEGESDPVNVVLKQADYVDPNAFDASYFAGLGPLLTKALSEAAQGVSGVLTVIRVSNADGLTALDLSESKARKGESMAVVDQIQVITTFGDDVDGWSELHFYTIPAQLDTALDKALSMTKLRAKLLGKGVEVSALRVSSALVNGDSKLISGPDLRIRNSSDKLAVNEEAGDDVSDFPDKGVLLRYEASDTERREAMLGGVPDGVTHHRLHKIVDPAWLKLFDAWKDEMTSGRWGYRAVDRDTTRNPRKPVTGLANIILAPGTVELTVPTHGLSTNDPIRVGGFKGTGSRPAGIYRVSKVDNDTIRLLGFVGNFTPTVMGYVRPVKYVIRPYTSIQQMRFTTRRRKASFFSAKPKSRKKKTP